MSASARQPAVHAAAVTTTSVVTQSAPQLALELGLETVRATVTDMVPEYHVVHIETAQGRGLALTRKTKGIDLSALRVGQQLMCWVTLQQPRVVEARVVA